MHIVIFTGGQLQNSASIQKAIKSADCILAADSGANTAVDFGISPSIVIGDLDSIDAKIKKKLEKTTCTFITSHSAKDETDTQLAINYAVQNGATKITLLGGIFGDRLDHILANLLLATVVKIPITFLNGNQICQVVKGPITLKFIGKKNDLLSLIPLSGDIRGLKTSGLQWELHNDTLTFGMPRGVSNIFLKDNVGVAFTKGTLCIVHTSLHA